MKKTARIVRSWENLCFFHFALCRFLSFFFPLFPSFPLCSFPLPSFCPSFSRPLSFSLFSSRIFFLSLRIFPLFSFLLLFSADKKRLCRCGKGNPQPEAKAFFMNVIYVWYAFRKRLSFRNVAERVFVGCVGEIFRRIDGVRQKTNENSWPAGFLFDKKTRKCFNNKLDIKLFVHLI